MPTARACCAGARPCTTIWWACRPASSWRRRSCASASRAEAQAALAAALLDAVQDDFWVLFVEQYPALAPLLEGEDWAACEPRLGPFVAASCPQAGPLPPAGPARPRAELPLSDRDRELARLVAGRCTNKEIAAALYLSEGTVKQYINQLYAKLDMGGDPRTRRAAWPSGTRKTPPGINQKLTPG